MGSSLRKSTARLRGGGIVLELSVAKLNEQSDKIAAGEKSLDEESFTATFF